MKQYRVCLFDLYGTLVSIHTDETKASFWKQIAACFAEHGAAYDAAALRSAYLRLCAAETDCLQRANPEALVEIDLLRVFRSLYAEKGVGAGEALLADTAWRFRLASTTHLRAYAGAGELLDALRAAGRTVLLLSNAQSCFTRPELELLDLTRRFDRIYLSSEWGFRKPDPRFFQAPLKELGLKPEDCLVIGNDPVCDVRGALAAGMDGAYLRSALSPRGAPGALPEACFSLPRMDLRALGRRLLENG